MESGDIPTGDLPAKPDPANSPKKDFRLSVGLFGFRGATENTLGHPCAAWCLPEAWQGSYQEAPEREMSPASIYS